MVELSVSEILKKVLRIQILANRAVDEIFAGQYKSVFRGRGMEFEEVREYQAGDEIRSIDWNVTARTGDCYVKQFREERELTVIFLVDISASGVFGSTERSKLELVVEAAALLMFSALKNNDKVGLITFCDEVIDYLPPRKGKARVLHLIRQLVSVQPVARTTRIDAALEFLNRVQKRKSVAFLISDFLGEFPERALASAHRRHDLTAISVADRRERDLVDVGFVTLRDAETGDLVEVDTSRQAIRRMFHEQNARREADLASAFRRLGIDQLAVDTTGDYLASLRRFFANRERRAR